MGRGVGQNEESEKTMKGNAIWYQGIRTDEGVAVVVKRPDETGEKLGPARSLRLVNHSPDGFEWGYAGSGPAQLALAILLDFTGNEELAVARYQTFKQVCIAQAPEKGWMLSGEILGQWLDGKLTHGQFSEQWRIAT